MSDEKKPFSETGLGKFLNKAKGFLPNAADVIAKLATGNVSGAIESISGALKEKAANDAQAAELFAELELKRMEWELEAMRIDAADRASARGREVDMAKNGFRDWIPAILSIIAILAFGFVLYVVAFRQIPTENKELFVNIVGLIEGSMITIVFNYYFGSSASSRRKTELLTAEK